MKLLKFIILLFVLPFTASAQSPPTINVCDGDQTICLTGPTYNLCVQLTVQPGTPAINHFEIDWGDNSGIMMVPGSQNPADQMHIYNLANFYNKCDPEEKFTVELSTYYEGVAQPLYNSFPVRFYNKPIPNFTYDIPTCLNQDININNTTCENAASATYNWTFGDGTTATDKNPDKFYSTLSTYTAQLCASNECGVACISHPITVIDKPNIPGLSASPSSGCVPFNTKLSSINATGITDYEWKVISTPNNCSSCAVFIPPSGKDSVMPILRITEPGMYIVRLIGTNSCGADTSTIEINAAAQPGFTIGTIDVGCNSLSVNFNAPLIQYSGTIDSYLWTFPSGASISTSTAQFPGTVTFTQTDSITLKIFGPCDTIYKTIHIVVNSQTAVTFGTIQNNVCLSTAPFNLSATPPGGMFTGTGITDKNAGTFNPAVAGAGTHTITYMQGVPNCQSADSIVITVLPAPVVTIGGNIDMCRDEPPLTLTANVGPGTWSGPGVSGNQFNPALANIGRDTVWYQYTDNITGCKSTTSRIITVVARPSIQAPDTIYTCKISTPVDLDSLGNINFTPGLPNPGGSVNWAGTGVDNMGNFIANTTGNFSISVTYSVPPSCDTTISFVVKVAELTKAKAGSDTTICASSGVTFMLQGHPAPGKWYNTNENEVSNPITLTTGNNTYFYVFQENTPCESRDTVHITVVGDSVDAGDDQSICETETSLTLPAIPGAVWSGPALTGNVIDIASLNPDTFQYTLTNPNLPQGCNADMINVIVASQPSAQFTLSTDTACIGQTVTIFPVAMSGASFQINWGDGTTNNMLTHVYAAPGPFTIGLTVNTFQGPTVLCTNSSSAAIYLIKPPVAFDFSLNTNEGCGPLSVQFTNTSDAEDASFFWDFDNGMTFDGMQPDTVIFNQGIEDTTYQVRLVMKTRCDTVVLVKNVLVHPKPRASFGYSYPYPCSGNDVKLNITSVGNPDTNKIFSSQGHFINANLGQPYYLKFFTDSLPKTVGIWLVTSNSCGVDTAYQELTVQPADVVSLINLGQDSTVICPGASLTLKSYSTPGALVHWTNPATGETFTGDSIVIDYPVSGQYAVILYAEGCGYDSTLLKIRVRTPPPVSIANIPPDCPGEPISIAVTSPTGTVTTLPDNSSSTLKNFVHAFDLPSGTYPITVVATDQFGCTNTAQTQFYLGAKPAAGILPIPPVCAGETFTATQSSTGASTYTWLLDGRNFDGPQFSTSIMQSGYYPLLLLAKSNEGCKDSAITIVNVVKTPTAIIGDSVLVKCSPSQVLVTNKSTEFTDFEWKFSDNTTSQTLSYVKEFKNGGYVRIQLNVSNEGICFDSTFIELDLPQTPLALIEMTGHCTVDSGYSLQILYPLSALQTVTLFGPDTTWVNDYLIRNLKPGQYDLEITSPEGCTNDTTLKVLAIAELNMHLPPDTTLLLGQSLQINTTVNQPDLDFIWSPELDLNDPTIQSPTSTPRRDRLYILEATNSLGCSKTDSILIKVLVNYDTLIYLPNAYTPGDQNGVNDYFGLRSLNEAVVKIKELNVYDLHGTRIYHAEDCLPSVTRFDCEWDGTFRGNKAEAGIYKVFIAIEYSDGYLKREERELLLIR